MLSDAWSFARLYMNADLCIVCMWIYLSETHTYNSCHDMKIASSPTSHACSNTQPKTEHNFKKKTSLHSQSYNTHTHTYIHTYIHTQKKKNRALSVREIQQMRRSRPHEGRPLGEWHAAEDASLDSHLAFSWASSHFFTNFDQGSTKVCAWVMTSVSDQLQWHAWWLSTKNRLVYAWLVLVGIDLPAGNDVWWHLRPPFHPTWAQIRGRNEHFCVG